jgi:hypothetical protein
MSSVAKKLQKESRKAENQLKLRLQDWRSTAPTNPIPLTEVIVHMLKLYAMLTSLVTGHGLNYGLTSFFYNRIQKWPVAPEINLKTDLVAPPIMSPQ